MPKEEWPTLPDLNDSPQGRQPVADLLRVLLKIKCEEHDVAPKLVASSDDLDAIAAADDADVPAMKEIGRASCRERGCQYVEISVVAISSYKHQHNQTQHIIY